MRSIWIALPVVATLTAGGVMARAATLALPQADGAASSSWPGFRGQDRDGVYRGPMRTSWDGLAPIWKKSIGGGRASFAVAGGRAFTIEQRKSDEVVAAYDVLTGKEL